MLGGNQTSSSNNRTPKFVKPSRNDLDYGLCQSQLIEGICNLGKGCGMTIWEIDSFIKLFKKKVLKEGYQILQIYCELLSLVRSISLKRTDVLNVFVNNVSTNKVSTYPELFRISAEYDISLLIFLCMIRQLQWTSSPIYLTTAASIHNSVLSSFIHSSTTMCNTIVQHGLSNLSSQNVSSFPLLIESCLYLSDNELGSLMQPQDVDSGDYDAKIAATCHPYIEMITTMRNLLRHEINQENLWHIFTKLKSSNSNNMNNVQNLQYTSEEFIPVLRLQYGGEREEGFTGSTDIYETCLSVLQKVFHDNFEDASVLYADTFSGFAKAIHLVKAMNTRNSTDKSGIPISTNKNGSRSNGVYGNTASTASTGSLPSPSYKTPIFRLPAIDATHPGHGGEGGSRSSSPQNRRAEASASGGGSYVGEVDTRPLFKQSHSTSLFEYHNQDGNQASSLPVKHQQFSQRPYSAAPMIPVRGLTSPARSTPKSEAQFPYATSDVGARVSEVQYDFDVEMLPSSRDETVLLLERVFKHGRYRLIVRGYVHGYRPAADSVLIGDEVIQLCGQVIAGKTVKDVKYTLYSYFKVIERQAGNRKRSTVNSVPVKVCRFTTTIFDKPCISDINSVENNYPQPILPSSNSLAPHSSITRKEEDNDAARGEHVAPLPEHPSHESFIVLDSSVTFSDINSVDIAESVVMQDERAMHGETMDGSLQAVASNSETLAHHSSGISKKPHLHVDVEFPLNDDVLETSSGPLSNKLIEMQVKDTPLKQGVSTGFTSPSLNLVTSLPPPSLSPAVSHVTSPSMSLHKPEPTDHLRTPEIAIAGNLSPTDIELLSHQTDRLHNIKGAIDRKRDEIVLAETLVQHSSSDDFLRRKVDFLRKVDELVLLQEACSECKDKIRLASALNGKNQTDQKDKQPHQQQQQRYHVALSTLTRRSQPIVSGAKLASNISSYSQPLNNPPPSDASESDSTTKILEYNKLQPANSKSERKLSKSTGVIQRDSDVSSKLTDVSPMPVFSSPAKVITARNRVNSESSAEETTNSVSPRRKMSRFTDTSSRKVSRDYDNDANGLDDLESFSNSSPGLLVKKKRNCRYRKKSYSRHVPRTLRWSLIDTHDMYNGKVSAERLAAYKISIWWIFIFPRKKLASRMGLRYFFRDILFQISDKVTGICIKARERKLAMLRDGAAKVIQRHYRAWSSRYLHHILVLQKCFRRYLARKKVLYVVSVVKGAVRIYRYLLYWRELRGYSIRKRRFLRRILNYYMQYISVLIRRQRNQMFHDALLLNNPFVKVDRKVLAAMKFHRSATVIQSQWRRQQAKLQYIALRNQRRAEFRIGCLFLAARFRRRVEDRVKQNRAAIMIQRTFRGSLSRFQLTVRIYSAMKITSTWRKHKNYKKLKQCLRRLEYPQHIVIHGVSNIPTQIIKPTSLHVEMSVWWTPLLHLVEKQDIESVIKSKQAQWARVTPSHAIHETKVPMPIIVEAPPPLKKVPSKGLIAHRSSFGSSSITMRNCSLITSKLSSLNNANNSYENSLSEFVAKHQQNLKFQQNAINEDEGSDSDSDDSESDGSSESEKSNNGLKLVADSNELSGDGVDISSEDVKSDIGELPLLSGVSERMKLGKNLANMFSIQNITSSLQSLQIPSDSLIQDANSSQDDSKVGMMNSMASVMGSMGSMVPNLFFGGISGLHMGELRSPASSDSQGAKLQMITRNISNFEDDSYYIPGCHGNTVISFQVYNDDQMVASTIFRMGDVPGLLYFGGEKKLDLTVEKSLQKKLEKTDTPPVLEVRIIAGAPNRRKCGNVYLSVTGTGPLKTKLRSIDFIKSFFVNWDKLYMSLDGENIYFYKKKSSKEYFLILPVANILNVKTEISLLKINTVGMQDSNDIIISTTQWDELRIRCEDSMERKHWLAMLENNVKHHKSISLNNLSHLNSNSDILSRKKLIGTSRREKSKVKSPIQQSSSPLL